MNVNRVTLAGNLTRDIDLKYTQTNKAVASFGIAINHKFKGGDGTFKEDVTFIDCEAWGQVAETMSKYLSKGRPVYLEGRLRLDQWDDKQNGQKRSKLKVVVESFQFVGKKDDADGYAASPDVTPVEVKRKAPAQTGGTDYMPIQEEDIPF